MINLTSQRVLLTGATSYLAGEFAKTGVFEGCQMAAIVRGAATSRSAESGTRLKLDQMIPFDSQMEIQVEQFDPSLVFHFATNYGRDPHTRGQIFDVNFDLPYRLARILQRSGQPKIFVNCDTKLPKDVTPYALAKGLFSETLKGVIQTSQSSLRLLNWKLERFFGPNSPEHNLITYVASRLRDGLPIPLSTGQPSMDFLSVGDTCRAMKMTLEYFLTHHMAALDVEIGSGEAIQLRRLVEMMKELSGSTSELQWGAIPERPNELLLSFADTRFIRSLGWAPSLPLREALAELFDHYKKVKT